jgi:hypothetical protein
MAGPTLPQPPETATLPAAQPCRQILSALQLKYSRNGYVNTVKIGLDMELERVVAFRSYLSSSHPTMIAELPLKWHGMWQVCKKGVIGAVFHCKADMNKACHHRFMPVCDGIMKYTDPFNKSVLLVEVSVFVGKHTLGMTNGKDKEIVDSAKIVVEDIDEEIVAEIVDFADSEWTFATPEFVSHSVPLLGAQATC